MAEQYRYEKYEDGEIKSCPQDDKDGAITGRIVLNVPKWFDENPEERIKRGWIKHIVHDTNEIIGYNRQTHFAVKNTRRIDDYTVEDVFHVLEKSEDQLAFEEMLSVASWGNDSGFVFF